MNKRLEVPTVKLVRIAPATWQLQHLSGAPLGVGLFANALLARHWARSRGYQVDELPERPKEPA